MVWSALWQTAVPAIAFNLVELKAWDDAQKKLTLVARTERNHFTDKVTAWERIMYGSTAVWGPMFLLGMVSLSDGLRLATSRLI